MDRRRRLFGKPLGLGVVLVEKVVATLFFGAAVVLLLVFYFRGITDPAQVLFGGELREDPHDLVALLVIGLIPQVSRSTLLSLSLASLAYLLLEGIEATGLLLDRLWVEWLILVETGLFLPYEAYELARHLTWLKVATLFANILILAYLSRRLVLRTHRPSRRFSLD